jgi:hypothetical protein
MQVINMNAKKLYDKMVDYKLFATVLLTVGVFFYLGTILPSENRVMADINLAMGSSIGFLSGSILLFGLAKKYRGQLIESEEGQDLLMKK